MMPRASEGDYLEYRSLLLFFYLQIGISKLSIHRRQLMLNSLKDHPILPVLDAIKSLGGSAYFVGGSVRDRLISLHHPYINAESKDLDVEVYGLPAEQLKTVLSNYGTLSECGQSFAVMKLDIKGEVIDFSLPRKDSKVAEGHKGFVVDYDPHMSPSNSRSWQGTKRDPPHV